MTDIEQKALALVNEVRDERGFRLNVEMQREDMAQEALCRAIEQHEAFRQEVSDAVENNLTAFAEGTDWTPEKRAAYEALAALIVAKSDPLVEVMNDLLWAYDDNGNAMADQLRAAIEKRGGKIVWGEG